MGAKNHIKIINLAVADSTISAYIDCLQETNLSIQVINGTITGTLYLEASDDNKVAGDIVTEVVFDPLTGTAGSQTMNVSNCNSRYYRVGYSHSSGTGKLVVNMAAKGGDR